MEAAESALNLLTACALATLFRHPASPVAHLLQGELARRVSIGLAMGTAIIAIVVSPWGKQSGAHFNPAVTITFYRLGKMTWWDATFYCAAQLQGAVGGVALASPLFRGAPANKAVQYAATPPAATVAASPSLRS